MSERAASRPTRSCGKRSRTSSPVSACSGGCASERAARCSSGGRPSIDGSVLKLLWSQAWAARAELGARAFGPDVAAGGDADAAYWRSQLLARFGGSIGGGTDEVHKNHVGERVLGLPPEPRVDRDRPWRA